MKRSGSAAPHPGPPRIPARGIRFTRPCHGRDAPCGYPGRYPLDGYPGRVSCPVALQVSTSQRFYYRRENPIVSLGEIVIVSTLLRRLFLLICCGFCMIGWIGIAIPQSHAIAAGDYKGSPLRRIDATLTAPVQPTSTPSPTTSPTATAAA